MGEQSAPRAKLYVGCSLSHASEAFKASVEELKEALRDRGYEVFNFLGLVDGTERDVYELDIQHNVAECDALIAICDEPSIGLGWEMAVAAKLNKKVLAVAHTDAKVTRLVLGAAEVEPHMRFGRYDNLVADVPGLVDQLFSA